MLTAVGLAGSVGIGKSGNDQGKQKPQGSWEGLKRKEKTSKVETWWWTKCSGKGDSRMVQAREKTLSCCLVISLDVQQASCFHSRRQFEWLLASALRRGIFVTNALDPLGQQQPLLREIGVSMGWSPEGDAVVKGLLWQMVWHCLALFLVACSLSWNLGCFCYSELSCCASRHCSC